VDIDLRRLRTFQTVADCGAVMGAARLLRITQPALSRQIRSLEEELGFKLFERVGRRLVLTPQGEQFLDESRNLLAHAVTLAERAEALRRGDVRELRVAASALTIEAALPTFLRFYAERVPEVRLRLIEEGDPLRHIELLERGAVHVSFNVVNNIKVDETRLASQPLPTFQVVAACAPELGIKPAHTIDVREVVKHQLLLLHPRFSTRMIFDAACRLAGVAAPAVLVESRVAHTLLALAQAGQGMAVVPSILRPDPQALNVMAVTHLGKPLRISLAVLWDGRRTLPRYAEGFADLLATHIRGVFADVLVPPGLGRPEALPSSDLAS
jgi:DNA-binding transcriptional LysR family regulator